MQPADLPHLQTADLTETSGGGSHGTHLILAQNSGSNGAPPDPVEDPSPTPEPEFPRVAPGWGDDPYYVINGVRFKWTERPIFRNGEPWPTVDHDFLRGELTPRNGPKPEVAIWVPIKPSDPILVGRTTQLEYEDPPELGYIRVILRGVPQRTLRQGRESKHAWDSIDEALLLARTRQFSEIFFNTSLSVSTGRIIQNKLRPDVFGIIRPELESEYIYHPREVFSGGQTAAGRQSQMPKDPRLAPIEGRDVSKRRPLRLSPYFREVRWPRFGNRALLQNLRRRIHRRARAIQAERLRLNSSFKIESRLQRNARSP